MIKIEKMHVEGFEPAIRGMRNPMNSWEKSDSIFEDFESDMDTYYHNIRGELDRESVYCKEDWNGADMNIGPNDLDLMKRLAAGGPVHAKYRRMITVWVDITAPLYWWKEFDTYKVGTVANSCSTMHKIHAKPFELDDFSHEHLIDLEDDFDTEDEALAAGAYEAHRDYDPYGLTEEDINGYIVSSDSTELLIDIIYALNKYRKRYLETKDKKYWWQMIQLLPSSYNQKRTVMLNYEVLHNVYISRKDHKLDEWHHFCDWIEKLPYSKEVIICEEDLEEYKLMREILFPGGYCEND